MPKGLGYLGRLYIHFRLCVHRPVDRAGQQAPKERWDASWDVKDMAALTRPMPSARVPPSLHAPRPLQMCHRPLRMCPTPHRHWNTSPPL